MLAIKVLKNLFNEWEKTDELIYDTLSPFGIEVTKSLSNIFRLHLPENIKSIKEKLKRYMMYGVIK